MRVTTLEFEDISLSSAVDIHFKNEDSAKRFSNYCLSLTGKTCPYKMTSKYVMSTRRAKIRDISEYPFTVDNYVQKEIVESFLKIFPEEVE